MFDAEFTHGTAVVDVSADAEVALQKAPAESIVEHGGDVHEHVRHRATRDAMLVEPVAKNLRDLVQRRRVAADEVAAVGIVADQRFDVCVPETRGRPIDEIQKDFDKPCGQWTKDVICSCCTRASANKKGTAV